MSGYVFQYRIWLRVREEEKDINRGQECLRDLSVFVLNFFLFFFFLVTNFVIRRDWKKLSKKLIVEKSRWQWSKNKTN